MYTASFCGRVLAGGWTVALSGVVFAQNQYEKVALHARVPIADFGSQHENANDVWGYVAESGREYAILGLSAGAGFVEISDPAAPVIVGMVSHTDSLWADIETYGRYAYVVNESSGGLQVIDLADIDQGTVRFVRNVTQGGFSTSHTFSINPQSGYAYCNGSNLYRGGLAIFSLANPASPQLVGGWDGNYVHDSQVVTYTEGPYAGREIAFCSLGGGLGVVDVTNKSSTVLLARFYYPNTRYTHQGWLTGDRRYFFIDDELDEMRGRPFTRTIIVDVSNINDPQLAAEYTNGVRATDHNLYWHEGFVYCANYKSGLRVLDASNPVRPVEVGFFDTWPNDDGDPQVGFNGAWSPYPFFPSGTVLIADMDYGLFVLDPSEARSGVAFRYPQGLPVTMNTDGTTRVRVEVAARHGTPVPGTGRLYVDAGAGFVGLDMAPVEANVYDAVFPPLPCAQHVRYYFSVQTVEGFEATDPIRTSKGVFSAVTADAPVWILLDDFQTDQGWTVSHDEGLTAGDFERAVPPADSQGDPPADADGSGLCFITGGAAAETDVDDGTARLLSPRLDLSGTNAFIRYARWFYNDDDDTDRLTIELSGDDGRTWIEVEQTLRSFDWQWDVIQVADYVVPGDSVRVRFSASDDAPASTTESAIDAIAVLDVGCAFPCDSVRAIKARCSARGRFTAAVRTKLPEGTRIHLLLDGGDIRGVPVNARGKAKAQWSGPTGAHVVSVFECPGAEGTAECP